MSQSLEGARIKHVFIQDRAVKVAFLNQSIGPLFRELIEATAISFGTVSVSNANTELRNISNLKLKQAPRFRNTTVLTRLSSWLGYMLIAGWQGLTEKGKPLLFIVTNPPLMPLVGWLAKKLKGQRYVLLFYDIYPEALIRFGGLAEGSIIVRIWRFLNRLAIRSADCVITISPQLEQTLSRHYSDGMRRGAFKIVPTWVDTKRIRPMPKGQNWFARKYNQIGKLTVLYSGNLGHVHDLTMLPEIASRLMAYPDIHFLVIGEGSGRTHLETECARQGLHNVTLLPLQDEGYLPFSLATGDVGIIALAAGAEGVSMPSKTYYMMAAGNALLGFSRPNSDLAQVIETHTCGVNVAPGDVDSAVQAILQLRTQPSILDQYRENARRAAMDYFSQEVGVSQMLEIIRDRL